MLITGVSGAELLLHLFTRREIVMQIEILTCGVGVEERQLKDIYFFETISRCDILQIILIFCVAHIWQI